VLFKKISRPVILTIATLGISLLVGPTAQAASTDVLSQMQPVKQAIKSQTPNEGLVTGSISQVEAYAYQHNAHKVKGASLKATGVKIVADAKKYLGVPYVYGGDSPAGFDCSGLTSYVYHEVTGMSIGRSSYDQIAQGREVPLSQAKVGDVLVFDGGGHVGIYIGHHQFIHAPYPGTQVSIESFGTYAPDYALEFGK
jgi:cell wall-associated NlpC family hydrolase